jgi:hypothetical protein
MLEIGRCRPGVGLLIALLAVPGFADVKQVKLGLKGAT